MARTMTPILKSYIDKALGPGGAVKVINAINSGHTAFDGPTRDLITKLVDGIGEMTAFETACTGNGTLSVAAINRLEHELGGRGNAEEFQLCVTDGTIT